MDVEQLTALIKQQLPEAQIQAHSPDNVHFEATIISASFQGMSKVKRQQLIYKSLQPSIQDGSLHAIAMKTLTPDEAKQKQ